MYCSDFEHDDVIEWRHFLHYWPFVRGIHRSPVDSPHKSQWDFNVSFDVCLNKPFSKPSRCWRFETPWCSLWHHCLRMSILLMPEPEYCGITTSRGNASQTRSFEELIWFIYKVYTYLSLTRTTRTPAFWGYPPPPHDYPYHWVILDPKLKEDKVKVTNLKNSPKFQIVEFLNEHYTRHTFWSCLIRCANMK